MQVAEECGSKGARSWAHPFGGGDLTSALAVFVAVLIAVTLLPALLSLLGARLNALRLKLVANRNARAK